MITNDPNSFTSKSITENDTGYLWRTSLNEQELSKLTISERMQVQFLTMMQENHFFTNFKPQKIYYLVYKNRLLHFVIPDLSIKRQSFLSSSTSMIKSFSNLHPKILKPLCTILNFIEFDRIIIANFMGLTHTEYPDFEINEWIEIFRILKNHLPGYTIKWSVFYNDPLLFALQRENQNIAILETSTAEIRPGTNYCSSSELKNDDAFVKIYQKYHKKYQSGIQKAISSGTITLEIIRRGDGSTRINDSDIVRIVNQFNELYNKKYNRGNALTFTEKYVREVVGTFFDLLVIRNNIGQIIGGIFFNTFSYKHYRINWVFYDQEISKNFKAGGASIYTIILFSSILDIIKENITNNINFPINLSNGVLDYKIMNFYAKIYKEKIIYDFSGDKSKVRQMTYRLIRRLL